MSNIIYPSFQNLQITSPFLIYHNKKDINIEPLSILYDTYAEKEVSISNIGKSITTTAPAGEINYIYLECDIKDKFIINSAQIISSTTYTLPVFESTGNSPEDFRIVTLRYLIGTYVITSSYPNGIVAQLVYYHLKTKVIDYYQNYYGPTIIPMYV